MIESDSGDQATFSMLGKGGQTLDSFTVPRPGGQGAAGNEASDGSRVAVVYQTGSGEDAQNSWVLYLWDRARRTTRKVAANPTGPTGAPLPGGYLQPILSGDYLYWIQASRLPNSSAIGSSLMQYSTATGTTRRLYNGLVTAAVAWRDEILFAGAAETAGQLPTTSIHAVNVITGAAVAPPGGLDLGADDPFQMVSSGDAVVWDSSSGGLRFWRPGWTRPVDILPKVDVAPDDLRVLTSSNGLGMFGPLLTWSADADYAMDLRSDAIVKLTANHGATTLAGNRLEFWQYSSASPPTGGALTYSAYLLDLASLPALPRC